MVYFEILCDRVPLMFTHQEETSINMQNLVFDEVSDGQYCHSNVNNGIETYNLMFMSNLWQIGSSVLLKYTVAVCTSMSKKALINLKIYFYLLKYLSFFVAFGLIKSR